MSGFCFSQNTSGSFLITHRSTLCLKRKPHTVLLQWGNSSRELAGSSSVKKKKKKDPITICLHEAELKVEVPPKSKKR